MNYNQLKDAASVSETVSLSKAPVFRRRSSDLVSVFLRVSPLVDKSQNIDSKSLKTTYEIVDESLLLRVTSQSFTGENKNEKVQEQLFQYDKVFSSENSQQEIYELTGKILVDELLTGHNGVLVLYGTIDSGKAHTIMGSVADAGLLPRILKDLLRSTRKTEKESSAKSDIYISMLKCHKKIRFISNQIYNGRLYDLLHGDFGEDPAYSSNVDLIKHPIDNMSCLQKHKVESYKNGLDIILTGRRCSRNFTNILENEESIVVCCLSYHHSSESNLDRSSALWITDLTEKRTGYNSSPFVSSIHKNSFSRSNTSNFWHCLEIMRHNDIVSPKRRISIPFKNSKLTEIFKHHCHHPAFGKMMVIASIKTSTANAFDTQRILEQSAIKCNINPDIKSVNLHTKQLLQRDKMHIMYGMTVASSEKYHSRRKQFNQNKKYNEDDDSSASNILYDAESDGSFFASRKELHGCIQGLLSVNETMAARLKKYEEALSAFFPDEWSTAAGNIDGFDLYQVLTKNKKTMDHQIAEVEADFEHFLFENGLDDDEADPTNESLYVQIARLTGELASAKYESSKWQKLARNIRPDFSPIIPTPVQSPSLVDLLPRDVRTSSSPTLGRLHRMMSATSGNISGLAKYPKNMPFSPAEESVPYCPTLSSPPYLTSNQIQVVAISRRASILRPSYGKSSRSSGGRKRSSGTGRHKADSLQEEKDATFFSKLRMMLLKVTNTAGQPRRRNIKELRISLRLKKQGSRSGTGTRSPTLENPEPPFDGLFMGDSPKVVTPLADTRPVPSGRQRVATPRPWSAGRSESMKNIDS